MNLGSLSVETGDVLAAPKVPAGSYGCDIRIPDFGGQHIEATALVTDDGCMLRSRARVAVPELEATFLTVGGVGERTEHVAFSVSAETRHDVRFPNLLEATKFVLGRNTGWHRAASLWHAEDGRCLGEILALPDVAVPETDESIAFRVLDGLAGRPEMMEQLRSLLIDVDHDFVPAISSRTSTTQTSFEHGYYPSMHVEPYLESMMGQRFVIATGAGRVIGMLSWVPEDGGSAHVSTVATIRRFRRRGIERRMYEMFEDACDSGVATVRTWSTNWSHLALLRDMGYSETNRIENHRGNGIDTVCLEKALGQAAGKR